MDKEKKKKIFTHILRVSKFLVFATFMYVSAIMYILNRPFESIAIIFAVAFFMVLNKLESKEE